MSRVRRVEANLAFPDRQVRLHRVQPTPGELEIYKAIAGPIQKLNGLAQISLAQALMSSPYALLAQIENMVKNDTLPEQLLTKVRKLVEGLGTTAKLSGLEFLVDELRKKRPDDWRLVVFTNRRETQRCISDFLAAKDIRFGLIRGGQEAANRRAIKDLWGDPPAVNVLVSTDAGAEGVNLQVANVLMNFDLPWNPMIVEQRIGRIQRLACTHANVFVVNTILAGTVEEHVVARLMEKLQLAAHAVGDIEALLESSGMEGTDDDSDSFESQIRELVVKSLAGQDVAQATQKAEQSIARAKEIIEEEEGTLNDTLGRMDGSYKQGPKMPDLERAQPSMKVEDFVVGAFAADGGKVSLNDGGIHEVTWASRPKERFTFDEALAQPEETPYGRKPLIGHAPKLYRPGQPAFERLVQSWIDRCGHVVGDLRSSDPRLIEPAIDSWCQGIAQCLRSSYKIDERKSYFQGAIGLRVQIAVAHDSFEKLLDLKLRPEGHQHVQAQAPCTISSELVPSDIHLNLDIVLPRTVQDPDVVQFSQFYLARCEEELAAAGADHRKQKKIVDDFTPKVFPSLVGLTGLVYEVLSVRLSYTIDQQGPYESVLALIPATGQVHRAPAVDKCQVTGTDVPVDCLAVCEVTRKRVLRHLLFSSEVSGRLALKDLAKVCSVTGKRLLPDEVGVSAVTGTQVALGAMRKSPVSAKMAEISEFVPCEITGAQVFKSELVQSGFSGKWFRGDQQKASVVSGKTGHISELIHCAATNKLLHQSEAAVCAVTHQPAISEALAACEVTGKRVLPSQLAKSAASGRVVLQSLVIRSTVSGQPMLQDEAIRSKNGEICLPSEARVCTWSGSLLYPTEVRSCALTALPFLSNLLTDGQRYPAQFRVLRELLEGTRMGVDQQDAWARIAEQAAVVLGKCSIVSAVASPTEKRLAVVAEVRSWLGLKVRYAGFIFSLGDHERIKGALGIGKRDGQYWRMEKVVAYPHAASVAAG
jgi:hypothetical protein